MKKLLLAFLVSAGLAHGQATTSYSVETSVSGNELIYAPIIGTDQNTTPALLKSYTLAGSMAFQSESPAATTASVTLTQPAPVSSDSITVSAGSGAYTLTRALSDAGVSPGQTRYINVLWPASTNPTLVITDLGSSATLATLTGTANAGASTLQFVFNGTAWTHFSKGEVPTRSLYSTVLAILGLQPNTPGGMAAMDANGNLPLDPWSQVNVNKMEFIFLGNSRMAGNILTNPPTQNLAYVFANLGFAHNHGISGSGVNYMGSGVYNYASGGAVVAQNTVGGTTVTPTTQAASFSAAANTLTLSGTNSNIVPGMVISGPGITYGTLVNTVSGVNVTLTSGQVSFPSTNSAQTNVTLSFKGNDFTDQYLTYVRPFLTPAIAGASRGFVIIGDPFNDIMTNSLTVAQIIASLSTLVADVKADGFIPIIFTNAAANVGSDSWDAHHAAKAKVVNDLILAGATGVNNTFVYDAASEWTGNLSNGVVYSDDGVHPNIATNALIANDLNSLFQANGSFSHAGDHKYLPSLADWGVVVGPVNAAFVGDNGYSEGPPGYAPPTFYRLQTGYVDGWNFAGTEIQADFTGTGSPGDLVAGTTEFKVLNTGAFGFGPNISASIGSLSGAVITGDASGNLNAAGTLTAIKSVSTGTAPTHADGTNATATVTGTATDGTLQVVLSGTSSGVITTLTVPSAYATKAVMTLIPANAATANLLIADDPYVTGTAGTAVLNSGGTGMPAGTYLWNFHIGGY